ncbi:MAG: hypothetical protein AB9Q22_01015 [Candidatus Reddybacter sp.]
MSMENTEPQEIIADIQYLESLIAMEEEEIKARLILQISEVPRIEDKIDLLGGEIAYTLGKMSARIKLLEQAIFDGKTTTQTPVSVEVVAANVSVVIDNKEDPRTFVDTLKWSADQFPLNDNLYHLENSNGILCRWTGPKPSTDILLPINRQKHQIVRIGIVATIKPETLEGLSIFIDGINIKYRLSYVDDVNYVTFFLPKITQEFGETLLTIGLPENYSPNTLSGSIDTRQLGVALSELALCGAPSLYQRFLLC